MATRKGIEKNPRSAVPSAPPAADGRLVRLLQLASPALPVGAYSYSQGLEAAVEADAISDARTAERWIADLLDYSVARTDAPLLLRLMASWRSRDRERLEFWNALFLASRETAELRAETAQMGYSLARLLVELERFDEETLQPLKALNEPSFPASFAFAAAAWRLPPEPALVAYLWAWLENQVTAAVKAVPLGQTDGQRILLRLGDGLDTVARSARLIADDDLGGFAPRLAIRSSRHETQYSRLFRS